MSRPRLLIVSNRLPVIADSVDGEVRLTDAGGGLASGLRPYRENSGGLWVGWPGDTSRMTVDQRRDLDRQLTERGIVPVALTRDHVERYYNGFANRVLWPLFHYLIDRVPVDATAVDLTQDGRVLVPAGSMVRGVGCRFSREGRSHRQPHTRVRSTDHQRP